MPVDDREDLDRLTRSQLYHEAEAQGIPFPPDHPKYIWDKGQVTGGMVALLKANGVTRQSMKTVEWHAVVPSEQEMQAASHQHTVTGVQHYPVRRIHQSARDQVDSEGILQRKIEESESKNIEDRISEQVEVIAQLHEDLDKRDDLLARLEKRLDSMDAETKPETSEYWAIYREAKDLGLPVRKGMRKEQLLEMIGADTTCRS